MGLRIPPVPSGVTGPLVDYLRLVARQLNQEPTSSIFSGVTPEGSVLGIPGNIAVNVAATSNVSRLWIKGGTDNTPSKTGWAQVAMANPVSGAPTAAFNWSLSSVIAGGTVLPTVRSVGARVSGIGDVAPAWGQHEVNTVGLIVDEWAGAGSVDAPSGYSEAVGSPLSWSGTGATKVSVFWKRATTDSEAAPTLVDPGDHQNAAVIAINGLVTTGSPIEAQAFTAVDDVSDSAVTVPGVTTSTASCLIGVIVGTGNDLSGAQVSAYTNAALSNITELTDAWVTDGNGGGWAMIVGGKGSAGAVGNTLATLAHSGRPTRVCLALKPSTSTDALMVDFTDLSVDDGVISAWDWDFGDDSGNSTVANPTHTYSSAGTYTVTLTVTDNTGLIGVEAEAIHVAPDNPGPGDATVPGGVWGVAPYNSTISDISGNANLTNDRNFNEALTTGQRIDVSNTTFTNTDNYSLRKVGNGAYIMVRGGTYIGQLALGGAWTGGFHDSSCILSSWGTNRTIDAVSVRNRGDSVSFAKGSPNFWGRSADWVVRNSALMSGGDDGIENDWKDRGTVYNNFISSVVIISTRPGTTSATDASDPVGSGLLIRNISAATSVITLQNNLFWVKGKRFSDVTPRGGSSGDSVIFGAFKWQTNTPANGNNASLSSNVILWTGDAVAETNSNSVWGSLLTTKINSQSSNVGLFPTLTAPNLPAGWPSTGLSSFTYLYGQSAKSYWNNAINAWCTEHSDVSVPTSEKGLFT